MQALAPGLCGTAHFMQSAPLRRPAATQRLPAGLAAEQASSPANPQLARGRSPAAAAGPAHLSGSAAAGSSACDRSHSNAGSKRLRPQSSALRQSASGKPISMRPPSAAGSSSGTCITGQRRGCRNTGQGRQRVHLRAKGPLSARGLWAPGLAVGQAPTWDVHACRGTRVSLGCPRTCATLQNAGCTPSQKPAEAVCSAARHAPLATAAGRQAGRQRALRVRRRRPPPPPRCNLLPPPP